jgi:hypothetical protein
MRVQTAAVVLLVVVLALVGWLWHRAEVRHAVEAEAAQRSQDSLALVIAAWRRDRAAERQADSARAAARIAAADRQAFTARAGATIAAGRYSALLDSLAALAPDGLEAFITRLKAGWAEVQRRQDSALAAADQRATERQARIDQLEADSKADRAACDAQVDKAMQQLDAANARARPGLLARVWDALPWVGGAAATGFVVGQMVR